MKRSSAYLMLLGGLPLLVAATLGACADASTSQEGVICFVSATNDPGQLITCDNGVHVWIGNGAACTATDNGDGTASVTCPDGTDVTWNDGTQTGASCDVEMTMDGDTLVTCGDSSQLIPAGNTCTVAENEDGSVGIDCGDEGTATITDDDPCTSEMDANGQITLTCGDSSVIIDSGERGVVVGNATLFDQDDHTGITVTVWLEGVEVATTATDENGDYEFTDLDAGAYDLTFTFTGYGDDSINGFPVVPGTNVVPPVVLYRGAEVVPGEARLIDVSPDETLVAYLINVRRVAASSEQCMKSRTQLSSPVYGTGYRFIGDLVVYDREADMSYPLGDDVDETGAAFNDGSNLLWFVSAAGDTSELGPMDESYQFEEMSGDLYLAAFGDGEPDVTHVSELAAFPVTGYFQGLCNLSAEHEYLTRVAGRSMTAPLLCVQFVGSADDGLLYYEPGQARLQEGVGFDVMLLRSGQEDSDALGSTSPFGSASYHGSDFLKVSDDETQLAFRQYPNASDGTSLRAADVATATTTDLAEGYPGSYQWLADGDLLFLAPDEDFFSGYAMYDWTPGDDNPRELDTGVQPQFVASVAGELRFLEASHDGSLVVYESVTPTEVIDTRPSGGVVAIEQSIWLVDRDAALDESNPTLMLDLCFSLKGQLNYDPTALAARFAPDDSTLFLIDSEIQDPDDELNLLAYDLAVFPPVNPDIVGITSDDLEWKPIASPYAWLINDDASVVIANSWSDVYEVRIWFDLGDTVTGNLMEGPTGYTPNALDARFLDDDLAVFSSYPLVFFMIDPRYNSILLVAEGVTEEISESTWGTTAVHPAADGNSFLLQELWGGSLVRDPYLMNNLSNQLGGPLWFFDLVEGEATLLDGLASRAVYAPDGESIILQTDVVYDEVLFNSEATRYGADLSDLIEHQLWQYYIADDAFELLDTQLNFLGRIPLVGMTLAYGVIPHLTEAGVVGGLRIADLPAP